MMNITPQPTTTTTVVTPRKQSPWRCVVSDFLTSKTAVFGPAVVVTLMLAVLTTPWITPQNPYDLIQLDVLDSHLPPGSPNDLGMFTYWPGMDGQGCDLYSGILYGLRISLDVEIGSAAVAAVAGMSLGLIAAYAGGRVDSIIMCTVDLLLPFPSVLVAMMILAYLGKSITNVVLTLVLLEQAYYARTMHGQALVEHRREYVEVARSLALPGWRIALRRILPDCLSPLVVVGTLQVARAITLEAVLSFLGLDVPVIEPSPGLLTSNGYQYMFSGQYWIGFYPDIALLLALVVINLVGDRLQEVLNPRTQR